MKKSKEKYPKHIYAPSNISNTPQYRETQVGSERLSEIHQSLEELKKANEGLVRLNDRVNHPSHYTWLKNLCGIEVIDITRHMDFNLGNSIKYILRSGHKSEEGMSDKAKQIEDLQKAIFYLNDEVKRLEEENDR